MDLNADLGESYGIWRIGDDDALLEVVSSANVACGFHGGDPGTLRAVCTAAARRGVAIGAQVSYPDLQGFGRRRMDIPPDELRDLVLYQIGALHAFASAVGARVRYVKPHGALYHVCMDDDATAAALCGAMQDFDPAMAVLGAPGSALLSVAQRCGLQAVAEAFADRAYLPDGRLVPRDVAGSVITDPEGVAERTVRLATTGEVRAIDGSTVSVAARSICVHGDTPNAAHIARRVRAALVAEGIDITPFTD